MQRQRQQVTQIGTLRMLGEQPQIDGDRHVRPAGTMGGKRIGERIGGGHRAEALYRPASEVEAGLTIRGGAGVGRVPGGMVPASFGRREMPTPPSMYASSGAFLSRELAPFSTRRPQPA